MRIIGPKLVKRANAWCVTVFTEGKNGGVQTQHWFNSEQEALDFIKKEQEKT